MLNWFDQKHTFDSYEKYLNESQGRHGYNLVYGVLNELDLRHYANFYKPEGSLEPDVIHGLSNWKINREAKLD